MTQLLFTGANTDPAAGCFAYAREQRTVHLWPWRPGKHTWPPAPGAPCICGETRWAR